MNLIRADRVFKTLQPIQFDPVTREQLCMVHDADFVNEVLEFNTPDGFGAIDHEDMRRILATNGAMLAAGRHAMKHGHAFAPVSGFHHAGFDYNGGFCTFNGLMVTAVDALRNGAKKVCILDLDGHYGDGTDHIIEHMKLGESIKNFTRRNPFNKEDELMGQLDCILIADWDLVIYQAGADSILWDEGGAGFIDYPLWKLKDKYIFQTCKEEGIPVVWNLAGGYSGNRTIMAHYSTWEAFKHTFLQELVIGSKP